MKRKKCAVEPVTFGVDNEYMNWIQGGDGGQSDAAAAQACLRQIDGLPHHRARYSQPAGYQGYGYYGHSQAGAGYWTYDRRDYGDGQYGGAYAAHNAPYNARDVERRFTRERGDSAYIDLNGLELASAECSSPHQAVAVVEAMHTVAREAMYRANTTLPVGQRVQLAVTNSDRQGHSFAGHYNFGIPSRVWNNLHERPAHMGFWTSFLASFGPLTGAGKVSEAGVEPARFELSVRAEFISQLCGPGTTHTSRNLLNSRWEPHSGHNYARLHVICMDAPGIMQHATLLRFGVPALVLIMLQLDCLEPDLILDNPVAAIRNYSREGLDCEQPLATGELITATDLQMRYVDAARRFQDAGGFDENATWVPDILDRWEDTLQMFRRRDTVALMRRIGHVLKREVLERAMRKHGLPWDATQIRHLDLLCDFLDEDLSLSQKYLRSGLIEQVVTPEEIEHYASEPPETTRAWTRAALLRLAEDEEVDSIDWSEIKFNISDPGGWTRNYSVRLDHPLHYTREEIEPIISGAVNIAEALEKLAAVAGGPVEENNHQRKETHYAAKHSTH